MERVFDSGREWLILGLGLVVFLLIFKMAVAQVPDSWGATAQNVRQTLLSV